MGINTETVAFIGFLNKLAKMSSQDIHPFSTATPNNREGLLYDDKSPLIIADSSYDCISYPLVADYLIDDLHHDIISTWTNEYAYDGIKIVVNAGSEENPFIEVVSYDNDFHIIVKDGYWYNVE